MMGCCRAEALLLEWQDWSAPFLQPQALQAILPDG
jgi:hypothetical protein